MDINWRLLSLNDYDLNLPHFKVLAESEHYLLGHEFESSYLIRKFSRKTIYLGGLYGDPELGLISEGEKWAIVFGHESYLWINSEVRVLTSPLLQSAFNARQSGPLTIDVLNDPWSDEAAVFQYDIETGRAERLRAFPRIDVPYSPTLRQSLKW